jgi:carboxypeptidase family protein
MNRMRAALAAVLLLCISGVAHAQVGSIAGEVRDTSGGAVPGVTVEATSPALIENVRKTVTDSNGRYQLAALPVGIYTVTFRLDAFAAVSQGNIELTSDFTAPVNAELRPGPIEQVITVTADSPMVDVRNATQRTVFSGDEVSELPTPRNLSNIVNLVPGIAVSATFSGDSTPRICSGGAGDGGSTVGSTSGGLTGCSPIFLGANAHSSINDLDSLNQGRVQVDGVSVHGPLGGGRVGYIVDVGSAREVTFTLGGGLGESETGGTTINIVPRTGGNRFAGHFNGSGSSGRFYSKNNGTHVGSFLNRLDSDYDYSGSYGGPIIKNRLWFYSLTRQQGRDSFLNYAYRNKNEGVFGANYEADLTKPVMQDELYRNINTRLTYQLSARNKLNLFWDEQFTCENPCHGTANRAVSQEAQASSVSSPIHVAQVSWNNPLTRRWLLEAVVSNYASHVDWTHNLGAPNYAKIPRVVETGTTTQRGEGITSGSNNPGTFINNDTYRSRASAAWVTGTHSAKFGYEGSFNSSDSEPRYNDLRLTYNYATPAATCVAGPEPPAVGVWCGLNLQSATDPYNTSRLPVPTSVTQYIPMITKDRLLSASFYAQDQWTMKRWTLSGALRYDAARSWYPETCVEADLYLTRRFCMNEGGADGVRYKDFTPRFAAAWDVFGKGKTAVKVSTGKYLNGAGLTGIYVDANAARRLVNSYQRAWVDRDGDRIVDCDLAVPVVAPTTNSFPNNGECGAMAGFNVLNTARRFGRSPEELDEANQSIGLGTTQCGRSDSTRIPQAVLDYCRAYFAAGGDTLLEGWNKRRYEWQVSLGLQHEILPRLSGEVTYNRRAQGNLTLTDAIGYGCDFYNSPVDPDACLDSLLDFSNPNYDFYAVRAPLDPRLPGGGGYLVPGFSDRRPGATAATTNAVTLAGDRRKDVWRGVDTNFVYRGPRGLRVSGGTSTGSRVVSQCRAVADDPPQVSLREGRERICAPFRPFQTNLRGTASWTLPRADVLVSTTFSSRPGSGIEANYEIPLSDVVWMPGSESRATNTVGCGTPAAPNPGCLYVNGIFGGPTSTTVTLPLISNDAFGERITMVDLKIAKILRLGKARLNVGADIYNAFNSDAAVQYCRTYPRCNATTFLPAAEWAGVTSMVAPRFVRFQVQADF